MTAPIEDALAMTKTLKAYDEMAGKCRRLFADKTSDYGTAWRILRPSSLTDQIFIKANRIRTLQETGEARVDEGIEPEFVGIVNYSLMAMIQCRMAAGEPLSLSFETAMQHYDAVASEVRSLMIRKNHDYGEAWRDMRVSSLDDLILMKVLRVKQIEDNSGHTRVSEGVEANYMDMANYAVFALILINEGAQVQPDRLG